MEHCCEVCESFRPRGDLEAAELLELSFGDRTVKLCRAHARIAQNSAVNSLAELRALYGESNGQRSYVARRAQVAAGRLRSAGRRASDLGR